MYTFTDILFLTVLHGHCVLMVAGLFFILSPSLSLGSEDCAIQSTQVCRKFNVDQGSKFLTIFFPSASACYLDVFSQSLLPIHLCTFSETLTLRSLAL